MLSLGVRVGSKISIGNDILEVIDIKSVDLVIVKVNNSSIVISDKEAIEILPTVFVQTGSSEDHSGVRLGFRAPRSIKILRLN